jgi:hypothetical protein
MEYNGKWDRDSKVQLHLRMKIASSKRFGRTTELETNRLVFD